MQKPDKMDLTAFNSQPSLRERPLVRALPDISVIERAA